MNDPRNLQNLIREAVRIEARLDAVDEASVRPGVENRDALFAEVHECNRRLEAIDRESAGQAATSYEEAIFQIDVASRALGIMHASELSAKQWLMYADRASAALGSVTRYIERRVAPAPQPVPHTDVAALAVTVTAAVANARSWPDVQAALAPHDLELAPVGSGLFVRVKSTKTYVVKASAVGLRYAQVMRKFGSAFPGHPSTWIAERTLGGRSSSSPAAEAAS